MRLYKYPFTFFYKKIRKLDERILKGIKTMFACDSSVSFRNEMKPFYWLEMTLVRKLTNKMAFAYI